MSTIKNVNLPDIGDFDSVDVIEILVKIGDLVKENDSIITLETDKATMEIPAPFSGKVTNLAIKVGDKVSHGDLILTVESNSDSAEIEPEPEPVNQNQNQNQRLVLRIQRQLMMCQINLIKRKKKSLSTLNPILMPHPPSESLLVNWASVYLKSVVPVKKEESLQKI